MTELRKNYVLDMIIKNLDEVNESLDKLASFTNTEISHIRAELATLISDVKQLKERPCPRNKETLIEIIEVERLKYLSKRPKKFMEIIGWVVAVAVGFLTIYFAIEKILIKLVVS
jgi:hypothetical protein